MSRMINRLSGRVYGWFDSKDARPVTKPMPAKFSNRRAQLAVSILEDRVVPASISGTVFNDINGNNVKDASDAGLAGVTVFLDGNSNGIFDGPTTFNYTGAAVPISTTVPVGGPVSPGAIYQQVISVPATGTVADVNVRVNISHTWDSDLAIRLISPGGAVTVNLVAYDVNGFGHGGGGDNYLNTIFDDQAATPIAGGAAPFTASFIPDGSLAALTGSSMTGDWTLEVEDNYQGDGGAINNWSITFTPALIEQNSITDAAGAYSFPAVANGTYDVIQVPSTVPAGFSPSNTSPTDALPADGKVSITVSGGNPDPVANFADRRASATIYGTVYADSNSNSLPDVGEGSSGVRVYLDANNNKNYDGNTTATGTGLPAVIPETGTVLTSSNVIAGATGTITNLLVHINLTHTYDGDIAITLISPTGTNFDLSSNNGGSGDNYTNTNFSDSAATSITTGTAPFTGTFRPEGTGGLATFNGEDPNGTWQLQIVDGFAGDEGILLSWSVDFQTTTSEISTLTDANGGYFFAGLAPATYNIRQVTPAGFTQLAPASNGSQSVTTTATSGVAGIDFRNAETPVAKADGTYPTVTGPSFDPYYFNVRYTNSSPINEATLGNNDVSITPAAGTLTYDSIVSGLNTGDLIAKYKLVPTAGWTVADNGPYTISAVAGNVASDSGFSIVQTTIATFQVAIPDVSGTVYVDGNGNSLPDAGEGQAGVFIFNDANNNGIQDVTATATANGTGLPLAIPDSPAPAVTSDSEVVSVTGVVYDVNVSLDLTHTWDSDLNIFLISPLGTRIELSTGNGGSGDNYTGTVFDDQAATSITAGAAPFSGSFRPEQALSQLNGQNPNGVWKLEFRDTVGADVGSVSSWSLTIQTTTEISSVTDANGVYSFAGLAPATYKFREITPANFVQVDPAGQGPQTVVVPAGNPGIFNVNFRNAAIPVPQATGAYPPVTTLSAPNPYLFSVRYTHPTTIDTASFGNDDVIIDPAVGVVTYTGTFTGTGGDVTANYQVVPTGGWTTSDNGVYTIRVVAGAVTSGAFTNVQTDIAPLVVALDDTFVVDTDLDVVDSKDAFLSLREAVAKANALVPSNDTITFSPSVFATDKTITLDPLQGPLALSAGATIGNLTPTAGKISVSGGGLIRVFETDDAAPDTPITFRNLTITGGYAKGVINGHTAGGLSIGDENVILENTTVSGNVATIDFINGYYGQGAGVAVDYNGKLTLNNSTISGNSSDGRGAGIFFAGNTLTVTNSAITGNTVLGTTVPPYPFEGAGAGIFIFSNAAVNITGSTISGNDASQGGGGIFARGAAVLRITTSTIADNSSGTDGGGISMPAGGSLLLDRSTVSGNEAANGAGILFAGNVVVAGDGIGFKIRNSTISGNTASVNGGGLAVLGTGVATNIINVFNSTITGNTAATGGGVHNVSLDTFNVTSTIITNNTGTDADVSFTAGTAVFLNSAVGVRGAFAGTDYTSATNLAEVDSTPAALGLNTLLTINGGGTTKTHAITASGKAANAGANPDSVTVDQNGATRLAGTGVDIGSFEAQVGIPAVTGFVINNGNAQRSRITSISITFAGSVTPSQFTALGAIQLIRAESGAGVTVQTGAIVANSGLITVSQTVPGSNTIELSFSNVGGLNSPGFPTEFGSLSDGRWRLEIPTAGAGFVSDPNLDTDPGAPVVFGQRIRRLFGDINGDGTVDGTTDFAQFGGVFGTSVAAGNPFDYNQDGTIDGTTDFAQFGGRFGVTV